MQVRKERRSNADRTQAMRDALITVARALFVEKGYSETSTPEIVAAANVTRGALYHHFEDKAALFRAVVVAESEAVAEAINAASADATDPMDGLETGTDAFLDAMAVPGRTRLLLIDGPAALGRADMARIDRETSGGTLAEGLVLATRRREPDPEMEVRATLLAAAFDRAALEMDAGGDQVIYRKVLKQMLAEAVAAAGP